MPYSLAGEISLFCLRSFMEAVKNGLHVHLGVSQNEKRPNALFLAGLEKEKPFLPVASAP